MRRSQNLWREKCEHEYENLISEKGEFHQNPIELPPSIGSTTPVTYFAASEAK